MKVSNEIQQAMTNYNNKKPLMNGLSITKHELEGLFYSAMSNRTAKIIPLEAGGRGTECALLWDEFRTLNSFYKMLKH